MATKIYLNSYNAMVVEVAGLKIALIPAGLATTFFEYERVYILISGKTFKDYAISEIQRANGTLYGTFETFISELESFFVDAPTFGANLTLRGTTTAEKIILSNSVYNDINSAVAAAKLPASNIPSWVPFTANTSAYTFAVNDYADLGTIEIPHEYKEGTDIEIHVHLANNGVDTTQRGVKYQVFYTYGIPNSGSHQFLEESSISAEITIAANTPDKSAMYLSLGAINGALLKVGTQLKMRLKRITATGTSPTNAPFVGQVGVHYQVDSLGSTTMASK